MVAVFLGSMAGVRDGSRTLRKWRASSAFPTCRARRARSPGLAWQEGLNAPDEPGCGEGLKVPVLRHYATGVTDTATINGVLRRALLAYNARAVHAGGEAAAHVSAPLAEVAADVLALLDAGENPVQRELLAEAYRCLTFAADDPLGQSCRERDELVNIVCHGLAHACLAGPGGRARDDEVHELLEEERTASLLAWGQIFPARPDAGSQPCTYRRPRSCCVPCSRCCPATVTGSRPSLRRPSPNSELPGTPRADSAWPARSSSSSRMADSIGGGYACWVPGDPDELEPFARLVSWLRWSTVRVDMLSGPTGAADRWVSVFGTLEPATSTHLGVSPGGWHRTVRIPWHRIVAVTGVPRFDRGYGSPDLWQPYEPVDAPPPPPPGPRPSLIRGEVCGPYPRRTAPRNHDVATPPHPAPGRRRRPGQGVGGRREKLIRRSWSFLDRWDGFGCIVVVVRQHLPGWGFPSQALPAPPSRAGPAAPPGSPREASRLPGIRAEGVLRGGRARW